MSPAISAFASIGISREMFIVGVMLLIIAGVIGMFWRLLIPGAIAIAVISLFLPTTEVTQNKPEVEINQTKAETKPSFDEHAAYIQDCMGIARYQKYQCENLWSGREIDEGKVEPTKLDKTNNSDLQLIDVDNSEYKARRAEALKNPNAVVIHETYH
jgi:hypothetical protein